MMLSISLGGGRFGFAADATLFASEVSSEVVRHTVGPSILPAWPVSGPREELEVAPMVGSVTSGSLPAVSANHCTMRFVPIL